MIKLNQLRANGVLDTSVLVSFVFQVIVIRNRSSRQEVSCKKGFLKNFAKLTRKHLCQSLFFNGVEGLRLVIFPMSGQL